jgi:hypothetical protein
LPDWDDSAQALARILSFGNSESDPMPVSNVSLKSA